jgi:hypothetical protein
MDTISKYHNLKFIHGWYMFAFYFLIINNICIFWLESNLFLKNYVRLWGTTKEAFVINAI